MKQGVPSQVWTMTRGRNGEAGGDCQAALRMYGFMRGGKAAGVLRAAHNMDRSAASALEEVAEDR